MEDNNYDDDDDDEGPTIDILGDDDTERRVPSMTSRIALTIFKLFSYCIQFLGGFFFLGLLLNLSGFGYTIDLDRGLVIDRISNIRNEVQFEREIERDEREEANSVFGPRRYMIAPNLPKDDVDYN